MKLLDNSHLKVKLQRQTSPGALRQHGLAGCFRFACILNPSGWRCPLSLRSMTDAYLLLQRNPTSHCTSKSGRSLQMPVYLLYVKLPTQSQFSCWCESWSHSVLQQPKLLWVIQTPSDLWSASRHSPAPKTPGSDAQWPQNLPGNPGG